MFLLEGDQFTLRLLQGPTPGVGVGASFYWSFSDTSGCTQKAYRQETTDVYVPLYDVW
jgi:hypothetical protein